MLEHDLWRTVDWRILKCEQTAVFKQPPVPRDSLLEPRFNFPAPPLEAVVHAFTRSALSTGERAKKQIPISQVHNIHD